MTFRTLVSYALSLVLSVSLSAQPAMAGLVAWWGFDSDSTAAGDINDQSGNGRNGSAFAAGTGSVGFSAAVPAAISGHSTNSLDLSTNVPDSASNGGWINMNSPSYPGILGDSARTVSAWINTSTGADQSIVQWGNSAAGELFWLNLDEIDSTGDWAIMAQVHSGFVRGTTPLNDGAWHHVAAVLPNDGTPDIGDVSLYVDGVLQATTLVNTEPFDTQAGPNVEIGRALTFGPDRFDGLIDDVALYDEALTARQLAALAAGAAPDVALLASVPEPTSGLIWLVGMLGLGLVRRRATARV